MVRLSRMPLVLLAFVLAAPPALAQNVGPDEARLQAAESLARRHEGAQVRWNFETGTPARVSFPVATALRGETPAECAEHLIDEELAPLFESGLRTASCEEMVPASGTALVLRGTRTLDECHVRVDFEEVTGHVPVIDSSLTVELVRTASGFAPAHVLAHFWPDAHADGFSGEVEAALATRFPEYREGKLVAPTTHTRVVAPTKSGMRPAFAVTTTVEGQAWRVLVDAVSGVELGRVPLTCSGSLTGYCYEKDPGSTPLGPQPLAGVYVTQGATQVTTDAQGNHTLTGNVDVNAPGLSGPLMHVFVDGQQEIGYSGPADVTLKFDETSYHTDEIAAWHHLSSYNAYFQKTYPGSKTAATVRIAVLVLSNFANAFFSPTSITLDGETFPGYIRAGIFGGRSAVRDASVIRHEYTHYIMNGVASLYGTVEAGGLNEGLADYFPCSQLESPDMGPWVTPPRLRSLVNTLKWPGDNNGDVHRVGNIFNGALWDARMKADAAKAGDRLKIDQTVWAGVLRFPPTPTLQDARDAIIAADAALNAGAFKSLLEQCFYDHGIGSAPSTPPPPPPPTPTPMPNMPPAIGPLPDQVVSVGAKLDVLVTATDPNGDPVTLAASRTPNGTFAQASKLPAQGVFTFMPTAAQVGTVRVTFTASDGTLSSTATVTIRVVPSLVPGSTAPTTSGSTAPTTSRTGTAKPGSTVLGNGRSGGGGGGGCDLAPAGEGSLLAYLPYALALGGLALRRRRRS